MSHASKRKQSTDMDLSIVSDASIYPDETFDDRSALTERRRKSHHQFIFQKSQKNKRKQSETSRVHRQNQHLEDSVVVGSEINLKTRR